MKTKFLVQCLRIWHFFQIPNFFACFRAQQKLFELTWARIANGNISGLGKIEAQFNLLVSLNAQALIILDLVPLLNILSVIILRKIIDLPRVKVCCECRGAVGYTDCCGSLLR